MTRILFIALAVILAVACVLGFRVQSLGAENERLGGAVRGLESALSTERVLRAADRKALAAHASRQTLQARQHKEKSDELGKALKQESAWADSPVPSAVLDALRVSDIPDSN